MSIKVAVRLRPFNTREIDRGETTSVVEMNGSNTTIKDDYGNEKNFAFDYSFWSFDGYQAREDGYLESISDKYCDQRFVYEKLGKEILDNAWEGYHCCLFAYGQTGSGKSYSMIGYGPNKGIVPISCDEIFLRIGSNTDPNRSYEVSISMIEIYNEKIQDLFGPPNQQRPANGLKLRENKTLGFYVENKRNYPVTSYEDISRRMEEGNQNRTISSTNMNATSSRAHTIITIEFVQITNTNGKRSEKRSNINLVDLAGSERASATGASGQTLKEGCNINKSLLTLGNVINVLADKAIGKSKNVLPPYRESNLTKILMNALGGNSKTVMICALSPASINCEETLSTLRYADRAKKIQNKAIINESETDKIIRQLREENLDLKKMIEDLNKKFNMNIPLNDEDRQKFNELRDQYEANQKVMNEMGKSFQERLNEAKENDKELAFGTKVDLSLPHLIVLNEDPQLSYKLKYSLKDLPIYVGRKHANPPPQITLSGIGIKVNHAIFKKDSNNNEIYLKPYDPDAKDYIFINGKKLINKEGVMLKHKDRIVFGTNSIFLYLKKFDEKENIDIDWEFAHDELQKEIDENNRKQNEENEKKKEEQLLQLKKNLEEKYFKEKYDIEQQMRNKLHDYEAKIQEMNQNNEKSKIETEKNLIQANAKLLLERLEFERQKKKLEYDNREKNDMLRKENENKNKEIIHKSQKLEHSLHNIVKKINKLKLIIDELGRNLNLEVFLSKNILEHISNNKNSTTNILVRVENFEEGTVYYWTTDTFHNRYEMMKELFDKYNDEDFDIANLKNEDDPLWDDPSKSLLGYGFYKLDPVAYLMSNPVKISIISPNGSCVGSLYCDVITHDGNDNEYEEIPEDPMELLGKSLNFRVYIKEAYDLPENFCKDVHVEYVSFSDDMTYKTRSISEKSQNPIFEENFEHKIEYLTKEDIEFLEQKNLCFKIYSYEEVEKKGKCLKPKQHYIDTSESFEEHVNSSNFSSSTNNTHQSNMKHDHIYQNHQIYQNINNQDSKNEDKNKNCVIY